MISASVEMMRRLSWFRVIVTLGTLALAGCVPQSAQPASTPPESSAASIPPTSTNPTWTTVHSSPPSTAIEDGTVNLSVILGQSGHALASFLAKYHLKEHDTASANDPDIPGGETRVYDVGNGVELQLGTTQGGEVTHIFLNHADQLRCRIEDAAELLGRLGITGLGEPSNTAPAGRSWRQTRGSHERLISTITNELGGYIWQVEIIEFSTTPTTVPSTVPPVALGDAVNLAAIIGQPYKSLADSFTKYGLKERDVAPNDDPDIPGGEIRVYDIGNGMELQLSVTQAGEVTCASVNNTEGLKCRIEESATLMSRFGITGLDEPEITNLDKRP